jgi:hypothetical protein
MQIALVIVFWWVWLSAGSAWAMLGQPAASVNRDQQALQAQRRTIAHAGYVVEYLEAADGTVVREYVSPAGLVFGLAWEGPKVPDMAQLLGDYFPAYRDALHAAVPHRGPWEVQTGDLVAELSGHLGAFAGRAYLVSLVRSPLTSAVIQ